MEKTIYQTKNKKFEILLVSSFIFGIIKSDDNLLYIAIGCFIFEFTLPKKKKISAIKTICALILLACIVLTSCGTRGGYGCKGNQSWNKMIYRNTKP